MVRSKHRAGKGRQCYGDRDIPFNHSPLFEGRYPSLSGKLAQSRCLVTHRGSYLINSVRCGPSGPLKGCHLLGDQPSQFRLVRGEAETRTPRRSSVTVSSDRTPYFTLFRLPHGQSPPSEMARAIGRAKERRACCSCVSAPAFPLINVRDDDWDHSASDRVRTPTPLRFEPRTNANQVR